MENPIKMDDLGVPPFMETPILLQYYNTKQECNIAQHPVAVLARNNFAVNL